MYQTILVPTDYSDCSRRALDVGLRLAGTFGSKVICLHASEDVSPTRFSEDSMDEVHETLDENEQRLSEIARDRLARLLQAGEKVAALETIDFRVVSGNPANSILQTAEDMGVDLIVIGTHGRSGFADKLMGSTAERVARRAACCVLVVKPVGFPFIRG